jgi:hypothetical protein
LPDGLFLNQTPSFGAFWKAFDLKIENNILWPFGLLRGHWLYVWRIGIFCGHLLHNPHFGVFCQEKSGNPGLEQRWAEFARRNKMVPPHSFSRHFIMQEKTADCFQQD